MIKSKADLRIFLAEDKRALGTPHFRPRPFTDEVWRFQRLLRKSEYLKNVRCPFGRIRFFVTKARFHKLAVKLGFSIPLNAFDMGLSIAHYGQLTVHRNAHIGKFCRIHEGVTIGANKGTDDAASIGDFVFIGSGAKVLGCVRIANKIAIGANAVVTKDFLEEGITIGGVPAKKISDNDSSPYIKVSSRQKNEN